MMKRRQPVRTQSHDLQPEQLRTIQGGLPMFRELVQRIEGSSGSGTGTYLTYQLDDCLVSS